MKLKYKLISEGMHEGQFIPLNLVFVDIKDIKECGLEPLEALKIIGKEFDGPTGINVFDLDAVTTTSDGLVVEGAIVYTAASDRGKINTEFGTLEMKEIPYSEELIKEEPHLKQWERLYPDKRMVMGPKKKNVPIHCCAMTGRACNNNSGTEVWNIINMEELLLLILGQIEIMKDGKIIIGRTGGIISVGIGMVVGEEDARILSHRAFRCGQTAHKSGEKAQTLKAHIPVIAADKRVLAKYIVQAINAGMIPGRDIGPSPAVLSVARLMNAEIDFENIEEAAFDELKTVGFPKEWAMEKVERVADEEIIKNAETVIPGGEDYKTVNAADVVEIGYIEI